MKSFGAGYASAVATARANGLVARDLVWITVRDFGTGEDTSFGIWSGDWTVDIAVISGTTGGNVTRTYIGGLNLVVGEIVETSDLTAQSVDIEMSAIADAAQAIMRGYDTRLARVEVHSLLLNPSTRAPVDEAELTFIGVVDQAPIQTAASGGDSTIKVMVIDDAFMLLTRASAAKRSDERQKGRSGDRVNRYSNSVATWQVNWGQVPQGGEG